MKFMILNLSGLRGRLLGLGAVRIGERTFEQNMRYDTEDGRLLKNNCLLRLRKDRGTTLTFKSPPPATDARFKIHRELEVSVSDFETMDAILNALGYVRCQIYEKWRETWQLNDATLCMDTMPFGRFLEIEGSPDTIMPIVHALGLSWERRILSSYLGIFEILREKEGLNFGDVTFDNFNTVNVRFDRYARLFEAGRE
ncbi:class IV adenylate cyclase [Desulfosarcina sp.]|uniref:class IV adenylate cyclase n=1 Tax=Desulfosarcina sp. TaxID=2027861 RepID=UPI0035652802